MVVEAEAEPRAITSLRERAIERRQHGGRRVVHLAPAAHGRGADRTRRLAARDDAGVNVEQVGEVRTGDAERLVEALRRESARRSRRVVEQEARRWHVHQEGARTQRA
jgi:hypothetical protein